MLRKFLKLLSTSILDKLYDVTFAELVRRGDIILEKDLTNNDRN